MNKNSNTEVIEQLETLEQLLNETLELNEYIENECPIEYADKAKKHMLGAETLKERPEIFEHFPIFSPDSKLMLESKKEYESKKKLFIMVAVPTVVCLIWYFMTLMQALNTVASIGVLATLFLAVVQSSKKKIYQKNKKAYEEALEKSNASIETFRHNLAVYEEQKQKGIAAAKQFQREYISAYEKYEQVLSEYAERKTESIDRFLKNMEQIKTYDFIPDDYYHLIRPIIIALKSGRADSYKEALNLAIQEEREERAEAARRTEDARRTQILQEQAAEERRRTEEMARHNREMERQQELQRRTMVEEQRRQEQMMREQQRKMEQETRFANERANREANALAGKNRMAGVAKCANCANSRSCPSHIKESGAGLNCGGYRPR